MDIRRKKRQLPGRKLAYRCVYEAQCGQKQRQPGQDFRHRSRFSSFWSCQQRVLPQILDRPVETPRGPLRNAPDRPRAREVGTPVR
jgi:hypothetical protein